MQRTELYSFNPTIQVSSPKQSTAQLIGSQTNTVSDISALNVISQFKIDSHRYENVLDVTESEAPDYVQYTQPCFKNPVYTKQTIQDSIQDIQSFSNRDTFGVQGVKYEQEITLVQEDIIELLKKYQNKEQSQNEMQQESKQISKKYQKILEKFSSNSDNGASTSSINISQNQSDIKIKENNKDKDKNVKQMQNLIEQFIDKFTIPSEEQNQNIQQESLKQSPIKFHSSFKDSFDSSNFQYEYLKTDSCKYDYPKLNSSKSNFNQLKRSPKQAYLDTIKKYTTIKDSIKIDKFESTKTIQTAQKPSNDEFQIKIEQPVSTQQKREEKLRQIMNQYKRQTTPIKEFSSQTNTTHFFEEKIDYQKKQQDQMSIQKYKNYLQEQNYNKNKGSKQSVNSIQNIYEEGEDTPIKLVTTENESKKKQSPDTISQLLPSKQNITFALNSQKDFEYQFIICTNCDKNIALDLFSDHLSQCMQIQIESRDSYSTNDTFYNCNNTNIVLNKLDQKIYNIMATISQTLVKQNIPKTKQFINETLIGLNQILKSKDSQTIKKVISKVEYHVQNLQKNYAHSHNLYTYLQQVQEVLNQKSEESMQDDIFAQQKNLKPFKYNNQREISPIIRKSNIFNQGDQDRFYETAGIIKRTLGENHPSSHIQIQDLFQQSQALNIKSNSYEEFIRQKLCS